MYDLKKIGPALFLMEKTGNMRVPGLIVATEDLLRDEEVKEPLNQVRNVASLPGIVGYSIAMPDMHWGYGFPIGGVAATDAKEGVISPGGVGYDINCGVRLAIIDVPFESIPKESLLKAIFKRIPSGVGHGQRGQGLSIEDYESLIKVGAKWSIDRGFGLKEDLEHIESRGVIEGADLRSVSSHAIERGKKQLGSVGSGNHFVEIGEVVNIHLEEVALKWKIKRGDTYVLIHSGSRGFGHQICQDTLDLFLKRGFEKNLPDRQLVSAPIESEEGRNYFASMAAAANFAFNNRQQILHMVRECFFEVAQIEPSQIRLIYDVCHNIAKFEEHEVEGKKRLLCVHRKGATRAFGPTSSDLSTGQPVLVPGDMGSSSYLLVGLGNELTFSSCCHGAGRAKSRVRSTKDWRGRDPISYMRNEGVNVMASSMKTITEEMPDAYKNVTKVVEAAEEASLGKIVARFKPHLVVKG